jgi:hypothetical protein
MVQSSDAGKRDDAARTRWFDGPRDRRVAAKRHVRPVLVVVGGLQPNQTQQMTLSEYDHVVQDLAPEGAGKRSA